MDKGRSASGGVGIWTVLLVVFVVLKIAGLVDWPWWIVLAPFWIPCIIAMVLIAAYVGILWWAKT